MIRTATIDDVYRIAEIHVMGWRFAYRNIISEEYLYKTMDISKRVVAFTKHIEERNEETYVFEENQIIKAFMTIGRCRDSDKPSCYELWGLYVDPFLVRNGIGAKLLDYCEQKALEAGFKSLVVWVLEDNMIGRSFYSKLGFEFDGTRKYLDRLGVYEIRYEKQIEQMK